MILGYRGVAFLVVMGSLVPHLQAQVKPQYQADGIEIPGATQAEPRIEWSQDLGLKHLDQGALAWGSSRQCVSCHTNGTYLLLRPTMSETLGPPDKRVRDLFVQQLEVIESLDRQQVRSQGTRPAQIIYIAAGLAQWDRYVSKQLSEETERALDLMFALQDETGSWPSLDCWPPLESHAYSLAQTASLALASAPEWLQKRAGDSEVQARVEKLNLYLRDADMPHDYARVLKLWASVHREGILDAEQRQASVDAVLALQQDDGGWSLRTFAKPGEWGRGNRDAKLRSEEDFADPASDGHMTGLALLVLLEAGVERDDPSIQRGIHWLKNNQRQSGRWWTRSLNTDQAHYITYSGSAYAMVVLDRVEQAATR